MVIVKQRFRLPMWKSRADIPKVEYTLKVYQCFVHVYNRLAVCVWNVLLRLYCWRYSRYTYMQCLVEQVHDSVHGTATIPMRYLYYNMQGHYIVGGECWHATKPSFLVLKARQFAGCFYVSLGFVFTCRFQFCYYGAFNTLYSLLSPFCLCQVHVLSVCV